MPSFHLKLLLSKLASAGDATSRCCLAGAGGPAGGKAFWLGLRKQPQVRRSWRAAQPPASTGLVDSGGNEPKYEKGLRPTVPTAPQVGSRGAGRKGARSAPAASPRPAASTAPLLAAHAVFGGVRAHPAPTRSPSPRGNAPGRAQATGHCKGEKRKKKKVKENLVWFSRKEKKERKKKS